MLLLAADTPSQALVLLEAHSFIYKLTTQSYSPEALYALDNFEVSTQLSLYAQRPHYTTVCMQLSLFAQRPRTHSFHELIIMQWCKVCLGIKGK